MSSTPRQNKVVTLLCALLCLSASAHAQYAHEEAITFQNGEQSVAAFKGTIMVPENRNNPKTREIPLSYVRFPATGNKQGSPIVYLSGGPGGSGINTAKVPGFRFPLFMAMREFGDVIALDQRGTGESKTAPKCQSDVSIPQDKPFTDQDLTTAYRKAAAHCVDFWQEQGIDVTGYTTVESTRDLDDLRKALGAEKITLWGISYGTHLAMAAVKEMGAHIEKIVMASAEGLNQTVKMPKNTDQYFERLQAAINTQPEAAARYGDIRGLIQQVHASLEKDPVMLKLENEDGSTTDFLFQRVHMQGIASAMIADPHRGVPMLLQLYAALAQGITSPLPSIIKRAGFDNPYISFNLMSFAMDVASGVTDQRLREINKQAETSLLGLMLNFPMPHLNKAVPGLDLGDDFREAPKSDIPTLLLKGTLDGRTYPSAQKEAVKGFSNLTQITVENGGHNVFTLTPEVTDTIIDFMADKPIQKDRILFELPPFVR